MKGAIRCVTINGYGLLRQLFATLFQIALAVREFRFLVSDFAFARFKVRSARRRCLLRARDELGTTFELKLAFLKLVALSFELVA